VEDERTLDALRKLGCDRVQGYHFSKALAPRDLPAFVEAFNAGRRCAEPGRIRPDVPA